MTAPTGDLREAAQKLADKLDAMKGDLDGLATLAHVHGGYRGKNFGRELARLKLALAAPPPEPMKK